MALRHAQLFAQFLHAVQCHVILPDGRHCLGHQRRQGAGCLIRLAQGAQQAVGQGGTAAAVQLGDQLRRAGTGRAIGPAGRAHT